VCPKGRVSAAQYRTTAYSYAVRKVNLVARSDDAPVTQRESRIHRVHHDRVYDRIDLVQANNLRVPAKHDFIAAADDIQVTNANVLSDDDFLNTDNGVQVSNRRVIVDLTLTGVDNAKPDPNALADLVTEKQPVRRSLEKAWKEAHASEHEQAKFTYALHLIGLIRLR
jgi:hypothetical protein